MKVKELIEGLGKFDPELDVLCYSEDEALLAPKQGFRLLDVIGLSIVDGEKRRGPDHLPAMKLGRSDASEKHVMIEVIADF
jgi:hypothetical protein